LYSGLARSAQCSGFCGGGVVGDAGGDQLGAEIGLVVIHGIRLDTVNFGFRIGQQAVFALEQFHAHRIGDEQHVGLRAAGGELGRELGQNVAGAGAVDADIGARIGLLEGLDGLCRVSLRLRRVKRQRIGAGGARKEHCGNRHLARE